MIQPFNSTPSMGVIISRVNVLNGGWRTPIVTLFYTYFVFICLIGLSPEVLVQIHEPVLLISKGQSSQLLDRIDHIFLTIWIIPMTVTIVSYLCVAGKSLTASQCSYRRLVWCRCLCCWLVFFDRPGCQSVKHVAWVWIFCHDCRITSFIPIPEPFMMEYQILVSI